jgi:glycosyltransferase involved in cell wall biosynthesis
VIVGPADVIRKDELFGMASFLIFPTRYPLEGQPLVILEAMSRGVVPITTDQGGIPDLLPFDRTELMVSRRHDEAGGISVTLERLIGDSALYERLSSKCLEYFERHLTLGRCTDQILSAIRGDVDPVPITIGNAEPDPVSQTVSTRPR